MSGGTGNNFTAYDSSTVTMSGGTVEYNLPAYDSSSVTMSGGTVGRDLVAFDSANIWIVGHSFAVDGVPVGEGPIYETTGILTGVLESGELIDNRFCHILTGACGEVATGLITLVPEPAMALLYSSALLSLAILKGRDRWDS